jgi:hypothetical protein
VRIRQWKKSEEVKLKAYLGQRMSIGRIKVLMGIGNDIVEKRSRKKDGWFDEEEQKLMLYYNLSSLVTP